MSGIKVIKFDLPINGIKVKTLDELRDNLSDELVALARSGQLERWFRSRKLNASAQATVAAVAAESDDQALFLALCQVLEVEVHPDDVAALFDVLPPAGRPLVRGAEEPELVVSRAAILGIFEDLLQSRLKAWRPYHDDPDWLCEMASRFDLHHDGVNRNYFLACKNFGWGPNVWIEIGDCLEEGDLIASVRNQRFPASVAGRIRSIGLDGVNLAVLIEIDAVKA